MRLHEPFYRRQVRKVQARLKARGLDGLLLLDFNQIWYLLGFFHYPCERPVVGFVPCEGEPTLFVPRLEADQAAECWVKDLEVYFEFPGTVNPLVWMCDILAKRGYSRATLGFESSTSYGTLNCLKQSLPGASWAESGIMHEIRLRKEPEEIDLLRRAGQYADFMVAEGVRYVLEHGLGVNELQVNDHVNQAVQSKMIAELDEVIFVTGISGGLVCSGPRSALAHGLPTKRQLGRGESLILSFACKVGGYHAESERVFFLGEPSAAQIHHFEVERSAQEVGTQAVRPGVPCSEPNRLCLDVIRNAGLGAYIKHRMGHGIGIQNHEPPWIEDGDQTSLAAGMVVSSEPGIYIPDFGGYRISDTVLVTETGAERLTNFPRTLEAAILKM